MCYDNSSIGLMKGRSKQTLVAWEGDSLNVLRSFPRSVREDLGNDLRRLQDGEKPINSRPMKSIGKRVYELKQQDGRGWYRLIYLSKVGDTIYILHCFRKQSRKTSQKDLSVAKERLKNVLARLREDKNERKT